MEPQEIVLDGRKYKAYVSRDDQSGAHVIIGPPEGLVDSPALGLSREIATRLHNILYDRGIFTFKDASGRNVLFGVLQDLYATDAQLLLQEFARFEKETV